MNGDVVRFTTKESNRFATNQVVAGCEKALLVQGKLVLQQVTQI